MQDLPESNLNEIPGNVKEIAVHFPILKHELLMSLDLKLCYYNHI